MKQAWNDLKSFITISMIILLFVIVIANLFGATIAENLLILITNLITAVFTYYFAKQTSNQDGNIKDENNKEE